MGETRFMLKRMSHFVKKQLEIIRLHFTMRHLQIKNEVD